MPIEIKGVSYDYNAASRGNGKKKGRKERESTVRMASPALYGVELTVHEGEFLGIIGHTGSGKSTLLQLLDGLILPTEGEVLIDGISTLDKSRRREARAAMGLVFQYPEYQLFEETVEKDIAFGPKNLGLSEQEQTERAREAMRLVGLAPEKFAAKSPFELSGGEKRRAALAGTVAMRPKYLALDEPMAGLDPHGRAEILEMLEDLRRTTGCAIIMVSHSMDDIARHADRVAVLVHGRLARVGTPQEIFSDAEGIEQTGMSLPQAAKLAAMLRARGMDIPADAITAERVTEAIMELTRGEVSR